MQITEPRWRTQEFGNSVQAICLVTRMFGHLRENSFSDDMNSVITLNYHKTNTYLIKGEGKYLLLDTDLPGTSELFKEALLKAEVKTTEIAFLMCSHYHPDHMGIAYEINRMGIPVVIWDVQKEYVHKTEGRLSYEQKTVFHPLDDREATIVKLSDSRSFLETIGLKGEVLATPGHSADSVTLCLDDGSFFAGDLNPYSTFSGGRWSRIGRTWRMLCRRKPGTVYYGHSEPDRFGEDARLIRTNAYSDKELYQLVRTIMKDIDAKYDIDKIQQKTGADRTFIEDVTRMYLTHQNVGVQGILDRIEIKGR